MKSRVVWPVFISAVNVVLATVIAVPFLVVYGWPECDLLVVLWALSVCQYGLVVTAFSEGAQHERRARRGR